MRCALRSVRGRRSSTRRTGPNTARMCVTAVRPIQLRASAEDAALMTPAVIELEQHYRELKLPVVILTGGDDQIADVGRQSRRLHEEIPQSELTVLPGLGHMVHHLAPDAVIKAIDRAAELAGDASQNSVAARRAAGRAHGS